jgi:hypothetical protein
VWLHIPSAYLASAPEGEASTSGCLWPGSGSQAEGPELFVTLSGKPSARPLWWRGWRRRFWITRLFGTISRPLTAARGAEKWILSLPGSPASPTALRAGARAVTMSAGCGRRSTGSFARWDAASCSWKTCQTSLIPGLNRFSGPWPRQGSMHSGGAIARRKSEPATNGSGCSSWLIEAKWPTAMAADADKQSAGNRGGDSLYQVSKAWQTPGTDSFRCRGGERKAEMGLDRQARTWATPKAADLKGADPARKENRSGNRHQGDGLATQSQTWATPKSSPSGPDFARKGREGSGGDDLRTQVASWATPCSADWRSKGGRTKKPRHRQPLSSQARGFNQQPASEGQDSFYSRPARPRRSGRRYRPHLNPLFVEWLMGWPIGWTSSACSATELCLYRRRMLFALCSLAPGWDREAA